MRNEYICANNLGVRLSSKVILAALNFQIARGERIAIIGNNGSGKTTLLRVLAGLLRPTSGQVLINSWSHAKRDQAIELRRQIGFAPDQPPLYLHDTTYDYLKLIASLKQVPTQLQRQRIDAVLEILDLTKVRNNLIGNLSKGTQQRINLAQAILHEPKLLILDEPTNALDPEQVQNFINYLRQLATINTTIIIASHHYSEVIDLCAYMLRLNNGNIEKILTPEIKSEYSTHVKIHSSA